MKFKKRIHSDFYTWNLNEKKKEQDIDVQKIITKNLLEPLKNLDKDSFLKGWDNMLKDIEVWDKMSSKEKIADYLIKKIKEGKENKFKLHFKLDKSPKTKKSRIIELDFV